MESLRALAVACSKKVRLSLTVAAGRSLTSSSSSFLVVWSALGGLPPPFLGASDVPRSAILVQRLSEERLTPKRRAAADLEIPSYWTALTILTRRSSE